MTLTLHNSGLHLLPELSPDQVKMRRWSSSRRGLRAGDLEENGGGRRRRKRSEMIEKIPVLTVSGAGRNRNLIK